MPTLILRRAIVAVLALAAAASAASAHSLKELEAALGTREQYFQPIDRNAPNFILRDAEDRKVSLASFRGKVVVLHFIYASCPDVCPLHADLIAEVQRLLNQSPMKEQVEFVSITTDPGRDTPSVLRGYGAAHGLDPVNWTFLTTTASQSEDATRDLALQFGHRFDKGGDGYQVHGVVTHVIDKQGRWRANFHGLKFDPSNLIIFVNALVNDVEKPHGHPAPTLLDWLKSWF